MTVDRIITSILILAMLALFFIIMPGQVEQVEDARIVPSTVPGIAIWLIITAGVAQLFWTRETVRIYWPIFIKVIGYLGLVTLAVAAMERFGFEYAAVPMALAVMWSMGERRWSWLLSGGVVIPLGVWLLVERVLDRTLA